MLYTEMKTNLKGKKKYVLITVKLIKIETIVNQKFKNELYIKVNKLNLFIIKF